MKLRCMMMVLAIAFPLFAGAQNPDGFFAEGALGRTSNGFGESESTVSSLDVGYRWSWFGVDVGYVDMSRANTPVYKDQEGVVPQIFRYGSKEHGVTVDVSGRWQLGEHWYYAIRAGLYSWHDTSYQTYYAPTSSHSMSSRSDVSWNAGAGFGYDFTEHFGIGLRYDAYHGNKHTATPISLSAEYRF